LGGLCYRTRVDLPPMNNNLEGASAFWSSSPELSRPDLLFVALQTSYLTPEAAAGVEVPPNTICIAPGLMTVASRGYLELDPTGANGGLVIQPNMLMEQADVDALVASVQIGIEIGNQPA